MLSGISGVLLQFSPISVRLFPEVHSSMLLHVFGLVAIFLGLMLIVCSRDLKHRAVLVIWEGVLRIVGGTVIVGYGVFGGHGILMTVLGIGDFAIGLVYLVCLPSHLKISFFDLLLDQHQLPHTPNHAKT